MKKRIFLLLVAMLYVVMGFAQSTELSELRSKAAEYAKQKDYQRSIEYYDRLIVEYQKYGLTELVQNVKVLNALNYLNLGIPYIKTKEYDKAKGYLDKALENAASDSSAVAMVERYLGHWYGYQAQDIRISQTNLLASIPLSGEAERHYALGGNVKASLREKCARASVLYDLNRLEESKAVYLEVIQRCEGDATLNGVKGQALVDIGKVDVKLEDYRDAISHVEEGYRLCLAEKNNEYVHMAAERLYGLYTYSIKDSEKAELWARRSAETKPNEQSEDLRIKSIQEDVRVYGNAVRKIVGNTEIQQGIDDLTALINRCENVNGYDMERLASYYSSRGQGFVRIKKYDAAISDVRKCIGLLQKSGETGRKDLADAWYQLAIALYYAGDKQQTMIAADKAVELAEKVFGHTHSTTLKAYSLRSNFEGFYNMKQGALNDRSVCFDIIQQNVERNFAYLTTKERTSYWNKNLPEITIMFAFAHKLKIEREKFSEALYNQQLLSKSILLAAENTLQRTIDSNPSFRSQYDEIRALRQRILSENLSQQEAVSVSLEADRMERELVASASGLSRFKQFLGVHATDVRKKLKPTDAAIEFVDYRVGKDSVMYAALLITPNENYPLFLPLLEQKEVAQHKDNLTEYIWPEISRNLPTATRNIYFAPAGMLYQIPIESQKTSDGIVLGEKYRMFRLSSTRQLVLDAKVATGKGAALYGDILYDATEEEILAARNRVIQGTARTSSKDRGASGELCYEPLPATIEEINAIRNILAKSSNMTPEAYTGVFATETSFKKLSQSKTRLIHVATHGYFNNSGDVASSLQNSGLCFAGADNAADSKNVKDNGILTAEEASDLDLTSLDMLCLSACETGLGEVTSDGVFGLQRGFKKAGANSILMSLWKVDDAATCTLMTEFYSNWIGKNMTKHDALEAAKKTVRETKGWEDPRYWAAFILLDGLD